MNCRICQREVDDYPDDGKTGVYCDDCEAKVIEQVNRAFAESLSEIIDAAGRNEP